jgi:hypothetical protein
MTKTEKASRHRAAHHNAHQHILSELISSMSYHKNHTTIPCRENALLSDRKLKATVEMVMMFHATMLL